MFLPPLIDQDNVNPGNCGNRSRPVWPSSVIILEKTWILTAVTIYELRPSSTSSDGGAIALSPNGLRMLDAIGLFDVN